MLLCKRTGLLRACSDDGSGNKLIISCAQHLNSQENTCSCEGPLCARYKFSIRTVQLTGVFCCYGSWIGRKLEKKLMFKWAKHLFGFDAWNYNTRTFASYQAERKRKGKSKGSWNRKTIFQVLISTAWNKTIATGPSTTSCGRHEEEEEPNKYFWGRSLAHFGSLLAATGQPAHASSKVQNTVNPNRGNWSKLQDFHLPAKAHLRKG